MYGPKSYGNQLHRSFGDFQTWYWQRAAPTGASSHGYWCRTRTTAMPISQLTYMTPEGESGTVRYTSSNSRNSFTWQTSCRTLGCVNSRYGKVCRSLRRGLSTGNGRKGAHDSVGVTALIYLVSRRKAAPVVALRRGCWSRNPGDSPASVSLTFMTETGEKPGPSPDLAPHSRRSVDVSTAVPNDWSVSTKVRINAAGHSREGRLLERENRGHDSIGATEPSVTWIWPRGAPAPGSKHGCSAEPEQRAGKNPAYIHDPNRACRRTIRAILPTVVRPSTWQTRSGVYEVATRVTKQRSRYCREGNVWGPEEVDLGSTFASILSRYPGMTAGIGFVEMDSGSVVNAGYQQPFTAASTTKVLTACYLLQQVEQGNVSLDASVGGQQRAMASAADD